MYMDNVSDIHVLTCPDLRFRKQYIRRKSTENTMNSCSSIPKEENLQQRFLTSIRNKRDCSYESVVN